MNYLLAFIALLLQINCIDDINLLISQANISLGLESGVPIRACKYDAADNLLVITNNSLTVGWRNNSDGTIDDYFSIKATTANINEQFVDAEIKADGSLIFVIGELSSRIFIFSKGSGSYSLQQRVWSTEAKPTCLWMSNKDFR